MLDWLKRPIRERRLARFRPPEAEFHAALAAVPICGGLDHRELDCLWTLCAGILADKTFLGAHGLEPQPDLCLEIAIQAALPILHLDDSWYRQFRTFIIYPDDFVSDTEEVDEAGVVHQGRDIRAGEAWHRGPVILSLTGIHAAGQGDGYNVIIHELAHQIDQTNGDADGCPPLHAGMDPGDWTRALGQAFENLSSDIDAGLEPRIDPYGAESPAEFFAVACEYFFERPDLLVQVFPEVYGQLKAFFRQDPLARMAVHP